MDRDQTVDESHNGKQRPSGCHRGVWGGKTVSMEKGREERSIEGGDIERMQREWEGRREIWRKRADESGGR